MSEKQTKQPSPEEQTAQLKMLFGGMFLLATAKYLPIVLVGILIGTIVSQGARGMRGWKRLQQLLLGISFFALILFLLVGKPGPLGTLSGLLYRTDSFAKTISDLLAAWNRHLNFPIIKVMRFNIRHITYQDVTNYFWIAIAAAAVVALFHEVRSYFKPKDKT